MAVPRLLLRLRKAVTGKRATPKELGYERDSKTGRLTKPGTKKFNEKIAFEKENKEILIKEYKLNFILLIFFQLFCIFFLKIQLLELGSCFLFLLESLIYEFQNRMHQ